MMKGERPERCAIFLFQTISACAFEPEVKGGVDVDWR